MKIVLRAVQPSDLSTFFDHQCDPGAADMVGFVPRARNAFDEHWHEIISEPQFAVLTVEVDGKVAGYVSAFPREGRREIAYWFGRKYWYKGIGRNAVSQFLKLHADRPIFGTVAVQNPASSAILRRCGFMLAGQETGPNGRQEHIFRLD